jgi:hypothetical protein
VFLDARSPGTRFVPELERLCDEESDDTSGLLEADCMRTIADDER